MSALIARDLALPGRLHRTDLDLASGGLICLIGPNGSGKTSLLHAIAGVGAPQGEVRLNEIDLWAVSAAQRSRHLTFLPASRELLWPLAVRDLAALGLRAIDAEARVEHALAFVDMTSLAERRADRLSTGERSRALIARALAPEPDLLLLDEPTANLDPLWQIRLMDHLSDLARMEGRIVLIALHDLDVARRYADRLLVMENGHIAADGNPSELLASPLIPEIFGIEWKGGRWRPIRLPREDRRSSQ